jgi:hypothetical protein
MEGARPAHREGGETRPSMRRSEFMNLSESIVQLL